MPKSPGSETRPFKQRRSEEGEEKFARELWIAIRNDHYMKDCWCGPPNIYNSREETEVATGHLRFYTVGSKERNLRVLQKKDDFNWHCICGNNNYHAVYKNFLNSNGKRPAEDSEIDLIAGIQNSNGDKPAQSIRRVVPAPIDPTRDGEEHPQILKTAQAEARVSPQSMWGKVCGILSRTVATMSSPVVAIYDTLQQHFRGDAYETLDTRRIDVDSDAIVVKRLKRQAPVLPTEQSVSENGDDGFDDLVWADSPVDHIGSEDFQVVYQFIENQLQDLEAGKFIYGTSVADIKKKASRLQEELSEIVDCRASIGIFKYQEQKYGPVLPEEPAIKKKEKWMETANAYYDSLKECRRFIQEIYREGGILEDLKKKHAAPPRRLPLQDIRYRRRALLTAKFWGFLRSLDIVRDISAGSYETISQMIVDVNAIHKSEMLPSFVALKPEDPIENMPGFFPKDKVSAMEEIPADEFECEALYERRFPDPEPSDEEAPSSLGDCKMVLKPKGILKPPKVRDDEPASPKYVATPERHRKLSFINPVSKFIPPAHIPTKLMAPHEAERFLQAKLGAEVLRDEHSTRMFDALKTVSRQHNGEPIRLKDKWSLEELEKDDQEMGLSYHAHKYDGFLNDLLDDLEKRAEADEEQRAKPTTRLAPQRHMVQIPLPPLPSTPARRQQAAHLFADDASSPANSSPGINPLRTKTEVSRPKPAKQKRSLTLDEFFAEDDDDLEISVAKFEQLQIDRQIRDETEIGIRRNAEEKRKREEEEARREEQRRLEEERRRQEEERRREQEARRQREAEEFAALTGLRQPTRPLITPLSDDWNCRVVNAARAHPTAELVKTLEGQPLTRRDFEEKLLPPTAWLNDNVIIGSILHVADYVNKTNGATDQEPKCAAFTSYFWPRVLSHGPSACGRLLRRAGVRKANFLDIDTVLIPICAQSHWTLAVIRPGKRTVAHIDSMRGGRGDRNVKAKLLELVAFILEDQFVEAEWSAIDYEAPLQTNGWDCGVFTITNAMCLAVGLNPKFSYTEGELTLQRRRLAAMLLNEGFKGEFSLDGF